MAPSSPDSMRQLTRKEAVARGARAALESLAASLERQGIAAELLDSGELAAIWVDRGRAEDARRVAADHRDPIKPVSAEESGYEFCLHCGYYHGPGAARCPRCGEFVRA
jgi:hypothetical protein